MKAQGAQKRRVPQNRKKVCELYLPMASVQWCTIPRAGTTGTRGHVEMETDAFFHIVANKEFWLLVSSMSLQHNLKKHLSLLRPQLILQRQVLRPREGPGATSTTMDREMEAGAETTQTSL